ncbi:hypothetical protein Y032_0055g2616 [Ancylostoma ceylanicum]|uniref:Peptidase M13 C-terminal domain-containing protein n=1 Tax=Ancylostoma ceylanicum TaxID=53326 RepID=A0A016U5Z7_9BILA|nr:hypothetical protein Y032_0055g2616 [Ancylostoma ceylanicum]
MTNLTNSGGRTLHENIADYETVVKTSRNCTAGEIAPPQLSYPILRVVALMKRLFRLFQQLYLGGLGASASHCIEDYSRPLCLSDEAYRTHIRNHGFEPRFETMQDFNNEKAFFIAYAESRCARNSWEGLKQLIALDTHSPDSHRVNIVLANIPEFSETFNCAPGTRMNPEKRCSLY